MRRDLRFLLFMGILAISLVSSTFADTTPVGPEFQVNTYTYREQQNSSVGLDANSNFIIVWESYWQDGSG